jgi:subtilisin family serine protease
MAPVAVALVVAWVALTSAPALADQVRQSEWWLPEQHIITAQQNSQGSGVTIAVLDTGVDAAAPDLAGSVLSGPDLSRSGRAANGPFYGIHGTEVASVIAGHGHGPGNSEGIIGVAPAAQILSVRVTLDAGDPMLGNPGITAGLPAAIAAGIRYATNNGASVIDLPMDPGAAGATGTAGVPGLAVSSPAEQSAVAYARRKGVLLVAPAGDDGAGAGIVN